MAGILDPKRRVIDAIVTINGRQQIAANTIDFAFASFSDEGVFYDSDDGVSARDISSLPMFEVASLPRDVIVPEVDSEGLLSLSLSDGNKVIRGRKLVTGSYDKVTIVDGKRQVVQVTPILTGAFNVYSGSQDIMQTCLQNFSQLNLIGTDDGIQDSDFSISPSDLRLLTYDIMASIDHIKPMVFQDEFSFSIQTLYAPPFSTPDLNSETQDLLADYPKLTTEDYSSFSKFRENILDTAISNQSFFINATGKSNSLIGQMFEIGDNETTKLLIIDYGQFKSGGITQRVYYLGKMIRDEFGIAKFCRMFTMVFER
jgi:hypothetical protein